MHFKKFIIHSYKAVSDDLEINLTKTSLLPVIGINESGKTSILWAIFAFDQLNDNLNDGKHLESVQNLYKTTSQSEPSITAEIQCSFDRLKILIRSIRDNDAIPNTAKIGLGKKILQIPKFLKDCDTLRIKRNLKTKEYAILNDGADKYKEMCKYLIEEVLKRTPYILYFDDFRDSVEEELAIVKVEGNPKNWLNIFEQLFKRTNKDYSIYDLKNLEELNRESVLSDVCDHLNDRLTKEWEKFTLEEGAVLNVQIKYIEKEGQPYLRILVKETVSGRERFFGIRDRSKGFYWFFNFVMKLEFNPKVRHLYDKDTIYLLDEPGSYLHSSAQSKLCEKLSSLSQNNVVCYCTHSHYLLDPENIPLNTIRIAQKTKKGEVCLNRLIEYEDNTKEKRLAFQPIIDALKIKPFITDLTSKKICIVEGIYDYYVFEMFKKKKAEYRFMPSVNAESIKYFVSICIGWTLNYVALWDNDKEGRDQHVKAIKFFGDKETFRFHLLPKMSFSRNTKLEHLINKEDIRLIQKELDLPCNVSFNKTIISLFFSSGRGDIIKKISVETKNNIQMVYDLIESVFDSK